jgi:ppGpp synthetase/RelA/SpoT-type nucleotidyltranferase
LLPSLKWISVNQPRLFQRTKDYFLTEYLKDALNDPDVAEHIKTGTIESFDDLTIYLDKTISFPSQHELVYAGIHEQVKKWYSTASKITQRQKPISLAKLNREIVG